MIKKIICLLVIVVMILSLFTGCGDKAQDVTKAATESATEEVVTETQLDTEAFTISISSWFFADLEDVENNPFVKYIDFIKTKYNEIYPNAEVVVNNLPSEKYMDVIKVKMSSASADEIVFHNTNVIFSKAGYLMDLSDMPFVADILDAAKPAVSYQGKIYGAPQAMQTFGCFYNKKIFADNQIEIPNNWNEFLAVAEKLKNNGIVPLGGGFKDNWVVMHTMQSVFIPNFILDKNPNYLVDLYNGDAKINGPEMKLAISKFEELATKGYFQESMFSTDWMASGTGFSNGEYAMLIQGQWFPGMLDSTFMGSVTSADTGYFPIVGDSGKPVIALGIDHILSINADVAEPVRAKDIFNIMISEEGLSLSTANLAFPGIKSNVKHTIPAYADIQNALSSNQTSVPGFFYMPPSLSETAMVQIVQKALAGKGVSDADLDDADNTYEIDKSLAVTP